MTRTNLPNTHTGQQVAIFDLLHGERRFFPTARQRQLCEAILSAPYPENLHQRDGEQAPVSLFPDSVGDSLTLLGYGGAMGGGKGRESWANGGVVCQRFGDRLAGWWQFGGERGTLDGTTE